MRNVKTVKPELMSLCCRCASQFYNSGCCQIRRADRFQMIKDDCTFCGYRKGFDYLIYPISSKERDVQHAKTGGVRLCTVRTA